MMSVVASAAPVGIGESDDAIADRLDQDEMHEKVNVRLVPMASHPGPHTACDLDEENGYCVASCCLGGHGAHPAARSRLGCLFQSCKKRKRKDRQPLGSRLWASL